MEEQMAAPAPKSPPMAFQMTSNDALSAPSHPNMASQFPFSPSYNQAYSPSTREKLDYDLSEHPFEQELQQQIQKQAEALRLQHRAFAVERECWELERDRLYRRVASLESLLKASNGHSPARSPTASPFAGAAHIPSHRSSSASANSRLPSIAEDDARTGSVPPADRRMSFVKREAAPNRISIPSPPSVSHVDGHYESVTFSEGVSVGPELRAPPVTRTAMSPVPLEYRQNAGHTPLRIPTRPIWSAHSPARSNISDGVADTPTRENTKRNFSLAEDEDVQDKDRALTGPLNMPELPNTPGEGNFTMDMLSARLRQIEEHPEDNEPLALHARCNRSASVSSEIATVAADEPDAIRPLETVTEERRTESTTSGSTKLSPNPASEQSHHDDDRDEPHAGIKLRKKVSSNFGAPFGQLGPRDTGFGRF